jgi:hypothetical protein
MTNLAALSIVPSGFLCFSQIALPLCFSTAFPLVERKAIEGFRGPKAFVSQRFVKCVGLTPHVWRPLMFGKSTNQLHPPIRPIPPSPYPSLAVVAAISNIRMVKIDFIFLHITWLECARPLANRHKLLLGVCPVLSMINPAPQVAA